MGHKVLVVDDDDIAGGLCRDLLRDAGIDADLLTNSLAAVDEIKAKGYELAILDILMPGLDGLTLCKRIKSDPSIKGIKVIMVSGKSFQSEKQRAREYGASLFIEKPYNLETFIGQIKRILGDEAAAIPPAASLAPAPLSAPAAAVAPLPAPVEAAVPAPEPASLSNPQGTLRLAVWGCRSLPDYRPRDPSRYGYHTSCVSVEAGGLMFIFDAGSGLPALSERIERDGRHKELWLFISHFHRDHIEGLPLFGCAGSEAYTLNIAGAHEPDKSLQELVEEAFTAPKGPAPSVEASIELYEMLEQTYEVRPGLIITSFYANHPGTTLGFILETEGRKLVYCPDSELYGDAATSLQDYDEKLGRLVAGADLLIHDGRYTPEDYQTLRNNGHSSALAAVNFAGRHGVKRLLLFHHDNQYSDGTLDQLGGQAASLCAQKGYALQCALAREGIELSV